MSRINLESLVGNEICNYVHEIGREATPSLGDEYSIGGVLVDLELDQEEQIDD